MPKFFKGQEELLEAVVKQKQTREQLRTFSLISHGRVICPYLSYVTNITT